MWEKSNIKLRQKQETNQDSIKMHITRPRLKHLFCVKWIGQKLRSYGTYVLYTFIELEPEKIKCKKARSK